MAPVVEAEVVVEADQAGDKEEAVADQINILLFYYYGHTLFYVYSTVSM